MKTPPQSVVPAPFWRARTIFVGPDGLRAAWRLGLYLAILFAVLFLLRGPANYLMQRADGDLWPDMIRELWLLIAAVVPAFVMAPIERRPVGAYGLQWSRAVGKLLWVGTLWGMIALSLLVVTLRALGVFFFGGLALHSWRILEFAAYWTIFSAVTGIFEEFLFRGYTQFTLAHGIGFWPAAVLISSFFGFTHLSNPGETWIGALNVVVFGLFFCLTLHRTGNLWFAVGFHASWNWGESFFYSVPDSGVTSPDHLLNSSFHGSRWLTGGSVGPEGSVLVILVMALTWVVFVRLYPLGNPSRQQSRPDVTRELDERPSTAHRILP